LKAGLHEIDDSRQLTVEEDDEKDQLRIEQINHQQDLHIHKSLDAATVELFKKQCLMVTK
jgi:hypothetical protein